LINNCMETIRIFVYDQILNLQIADDNTLNIEDRIVYTKPINLFKGIDNVIKVLIKNSDQKVVDITTLTFYAELVKSPQQDFVGSFTLVTTSALLGEAKLTIPAYILNPQEIGNYYILIKYSSGGNDIPAFADDNYQIAIPSYLSLGYRVPGDVYDLSDNLDLGSIPELEDEIRDLGAL